MRVVAAPMAGGPSTPSLVAAVSAAGGFGFVPAGYLTTSAVAASLATTRQLTSEPFGINLFVPSAPTSDPAVAAYAASLPGAAATRWEDDEWDAKLALAAGLPVVSFTFGCPSPVEVAALRAAGSRVAVTVTTAAEAEAAGDVDVLLLQGSEAGGHRGSWADDEDPPLPLEALLAVCRDDLPRWAAGGLMTAEDVTRVLDLGAAAAVLGTAFLLCPEAATSPTHRAALRSPRFVETGLTRAFTGRTARGLVNDFMTDHAGAPRGYPEIHHATRPIRQAAAAAGDPESLHLWAGTGWQRCQELPAGDLVRRLSSS